MANMVLVGLIGALVLSKSIMGLVYGNAFEIYSSTSNEIFKETYPELLRVSRDRDDLVSDHVAWVNGQLHWKPLFLREVQDWEIELLEHFFDDLHAVKVTDMADDDWCSSHQRKDFKFKVSIDRLVRKCNICPISL